MTIRWRPLGFTIIALILVGAVERLSSRTTDSHEQVGREDASVKDKAKPENAMTAKRSAALIVPLYAVGDILVAAREKPRNPKKIRTTKPSLRTDRDGPAAMPTPGSGDRPVLEVDYKEIGFERYLDVIERVGRFFIVLKHGETISLGSQILLREGLIYAGGADMDLLAAQRPHLVSDALIASRLASIGLPENAMPDSVVLIFTRPFDSLLWDTITESLSERGVTLDRIERITGAYENRGGGVFLRLDRAVVKDGKKKLLLDMRLRVSL